MPPSAHGPVGQPEPASSVPPRRGSTLADPYVASQTHLLKPTSKNPLPTVVPPPLAANAGTLGVRHVLCVIGMPGRGKPFISRRLEAYLSFFHGAEVQIFNICEYMEGPVGSDENAEALLADLRDFMGKRNDAAGGNLSCVQAHAENGSGAGSAAVNGCGASAGCGCGAASAARSAAAAAHHATSGIMDEDDHRRKNVDSGKVHARPDPHSHPTSGSRRPPRKSAGSRPPEPDAAPPSPATGGDHHVVRLGRVVP